MKIAFVLIFAATVATAQLTPGVIDKNNEAVKLLESEKNFEAYKTLTEGLADSPFQDELHLNLGFAFDRNGEKEKALAEYQNVARATKNPAYRFQALFNAARIQGEAKRIDEALNLYQKALEIIPDSNEVKTNIELLLASGGGGGGGGQNDQNQSGDKNKENEDGQGDNKNQKPKPNQKPTPQPFKSGELNNQDVKNILDELKRQENQIRAKENEKKPKENRSGKDW